jgi:hypothetical protein
MTMVADPLSNDFWEQWRELGAYRGMDGRWWIRQPQVRPDVTPGDLPTPWWAWWTWRKRREYLRWLRRWGLRGLG